MTKLISKPNHKLRKSNALIVSFGIPAYLTCSKALDCIHYCFGLKPMYMWDNTDKAFHWRFEQSKTSDFARNLHDELNRMRNRPNYFRIHDIGDFYCDTYLLKWFSICNANPDIQFYAYTKEVARLKKHRASYPDNFTIIFSYGGKEDDLIDPEVDRYSYVFTDLETLERTGHANASNDDLIAAYGENRRIGLVIH